MIVLLMWFSFALIYFWQQNYEKTFLPNISLLFVTEKQNKLDGARMKSVISETC